jgi:hypothetical protein
MVINRADHIKGLDTQVKAEESMWRAGAVIKGPLPRSLCEWGVSECSERHSRRQACWGRLPRTHAQCLWNGLEFAPGTSAHIRVGVHPAPRQVVTQPDQQACRGCMQYWQQGRGMRTFHSEVSRPSVNHRELSAISVPTPEHAVQKPRLITSGQTLRRPLPGGAPGSAN